jgi:hypothetical protein
MRDREENVDRADHNLAGAREQAGSEPRDESSDEQAGSKDRQDASAHGPRDGYEEARIDSDDVQADGAKGSDRGGSAGWGSESSGGSTVDKRGQGS